MNDAQQDPTHSEEKGISVLDLLILFARHKKVVLGAPAIAAAVSLAISFLLPNWYISSTKIMPPQQSQSNAVAILGQLGALSGGLAGQALGLKNPSDIYVAMLKSRTVADELIRRFDLRKVYNEKYFLDARKELARNSSITASREGVITIDVEDKDPKRAAEIANAYVEAIRNLTLQLAVSEAGQRRLFFEGQLKKAKNELANAEGELKKFTQDAGLVNPQGQVGLTVAAAAALRAQIAAKEIQLTAMRTFATPSNPDVLRSNQELAGLRSELQKLEKTSVRSGEGDVYVPMGKAPEVAMEYVRKFRDMRYYETLYEILAKQYEIARIDEAKDATLIQVLDVAVEPEKKSWPKRWLIVLLVGALTSLAVCSAIYLLETMKKSGRDTGTSSKLTELARLLRLRRK
jgi:tyrosine-protein kinase Etk/Wzc